MVADLPANVEVTIREAEDRRLLFVLSTDVAEFELSPLPSGVC